MTNQNQARDPRHCLEKFRNPTHFLPVQFFCPIPLERPGSRLEPGRSDWQNKSKSESSPRTCSKRKLCTLMEIPPTAYIVKSYFQVG
jgi:hypothetical protein